MRTIFVLLALAFLPVLCKADPIGVTDYQINITATWIETNPACISNCTENMNISYVFEKNNSPNVQGFGWVDLSTLQESSSGFLGSFVFKGPTSGLWEDDLMPSADGMPFYNSLLNEKGYSDEIDLGMMGPGLYKGNEFNNGGPYMFIYDCFSESCQNAYPRTNPQEEKMANRETSTAVKVPAFDSMWELIVVSVGACTFGFFVKHRLVLAPSRLVYRREC
jgi:hypothetical protein